MVPIPTPWAYSRWRGSKEIPGVLYAPQVTPWGEIVNDLERPVFDLNDTTAIADFILNEVDL